MNGTNLHNSFSELKGKGVFTAESQRTQSYNGIFRPRLQNVAQKELCADKFVGEKNVGRSKSILCWEEKNNVDKDQAV